MEGVTKRRRIAERERENGLGVNIAGSEVSAAEHSEYREIGGQHSRR